MSTSSQLKPSHHNVNPAYDQWEWQEGSNIWRRYPCTISHKLNSIPDGNSIYVSIYDWIYLITRHTPMSGTQTNLFTQHTRKIRLIRHPSTSKYDEKEETK
eukprot:132480_1